MIDVATDKLLSLEDVSERFPRRHGKPLSIQAVKAWITRGCRGVRLEAVPFGGKMVTSEDALRRFSSDLARRRSGETGDRDCVQERSAIESERSNAGALDALAKEGFAVAP